MKKRFLTYSIFLALVGLGISRASAQQTSIKIGTNPTSVTQSAVLEAEATNKGALLPRVALTGTTDVTTIASPANSLTVFNTATAGTAPNAVTPGYYYWSTPDAKWIRLQDKAIGDLRLVGTYNHITQDAGVGLNGTSVGTGTNNIGIGYQTLANNTTGEWNVAVGNSSLSANTSGTFNTAIGKQALPANISGNRNTASGTAVLYVNTTGNQNSAFGQEALYRATTGSNNTALGFQAGGGFGGITTGSNNLLLGSSTDVASRTASNQMNIGNAIFGTGMNGSVTAPAGLVGINVIAPSNTLHVKATANPLRLEGLQTGLLTDNVVVADGNGVLKTVAPGIGDLRLVGNDNHITQDAGVGGNGSSVGTGYNNIGIGASVLQANVNGRANVAIGNNTLTKNTSGYNNVALGYQALQENTDGTGNVAHGAYALKLNTTGVANTAIGERAIQKSTTGDYNTASGAEVLGANTTGSYNVATGAYALGSNTIGDDNTAIGQDAMASNTTGNSNTALGKRAGNTLTTGSNNLIIGKDTNVASPTADYQMNIGNTIFGTGMSGSLANPAGLVGINTAAPNSTLEVNGSMSLPIVTISADYTVTNADFTIVVKNANSNNINITFPSAAANKGRIYKIIPHPTISSPRFTLLGVTAVQNPNANATASSIFGYGKYEIQSDGTDWLILNSL